VLEVIVRDVRFAARGFGRNPGFAVSCIVTLALGIGAATAVFSVLYGVLLRPLPYPHADRLVQLVQVTPQRGGSVAFRGGLTPEQIHILRTSSHTMERVSFAIPALAGGAITGNGTPVRLAGVQVAASLFDMLGVRPMLGRVFTEEEERATLTVDGERVIILSYDTWTTHFDADDRVVGRTTTLNGRAHRIVGVMPDGFGFPSIANPDALTSSGTPADAPEFWMPLGLRPTTSRGGMVPTTYALLRDGHSREAAAAEANVIVPPKPNETAKFPLELVDLRTESARNISGVLWMFQGGVALVLLIACVNVVHLLQARAIQRSHDVWVHLSLGASRYTVVRYAIVETLVLTLAAAALGAVLAQGLVTMLRWLPGYLLPRVTDVRVDGPVLAFAAAVAVVAGVTIGLLAVLRTAARPPQLQRHATTRRLPPALLVVEVAGAMLLLVSGGLLVNSAVNLSRVDLGFEAERALLFRINVPAGPYAGMPAREALYDEVDARLRALPMVSAVGVTVNGVATETAGIRWPLIIGSQRYDEGMLFRDVSPGYFASLGIPVLVGREFIRADRGERPRTMIVNGEFAQAYFGRLNVVGERVTFGDDEGLEIVGVVGGVRAATGAARDTPAHVSGRPPQLYLPAVYLAGPRAMGIVRTSADPAALAGSVRAAISGIDPRLVVFDVQPLEAQVERSIIAWQVYATVSSAFAVVAVLLAAIGLYGVLTHSVGLRTREFGIRIAVGATPAALIGAVMREGVTITAAGIVVGLVLALQTSHFMAALLFGVTPLDARTYGAVAALFMAVTALACYLPARRTTRIDPVTALRAE
jgi:putative ABC transport system permease protein